MRLAFDSNGDISSHNSSVVSTNDAKGELGRFLFYNSVNKGTYQYDPLFGNTIYKMVGRTKTGDGLKVIQKLMETDIITSNLFADISTKVSVVSLNRNRVGIHISGIGITASWEILTSAGRGGTLVNYNEGTVISSEEPIISEKVFKDFDTQKVNFDITSAYNKTMEKNNITSLGEVEFNLRILYLANNATEPRIVKDYEYNLSEGLESREVLFHRPFSLSGTLTFQVWPSKSIIQQSDNIYLLRKKRTSNPTTINNSY